MSSPVWGQFVDHDIDHSAVGIVKFPFQLVAASRQQEAE
jgi:hypothetical protein